VCGGREIAKTISGVWNRRKGKEKNNTNKKNDKEREIEKYKNTSKSRGTDNPDKKRARQEGDTLSKCEPEKKFSYTFLPFFFGCFAHTLVFVFEIDIINHESSPHLMYFLLFEEQIHHQ